MDTWYISIGFDASTAFSSDIAFDVSEQLSDFGAVMSIGRDSASGTIALTVDGREWKLALETANAAVLKSLSSEGLDVRVSSVSVKNQEEFHRNLNEPI